MSYKELDTINAISFKKQNSQYNMYLCNPKSASLSLINHIKYNEPYYLINSSKKNIKISEFCKQSNNYNVIYVNSQR